MKNEVVTIDQETLRKIKRGHVRQQKKEQGAFDGRYQTKAVQSKKKYNKKDRRENKKVTW